MVGDGPLVCGSVILGGWGVAVYPCSRDEDTDSFQDILEADRVE